MSYSACRSLGNGLLVALCALGGTASFSQADDETAPATKEFTSSEGGFSVALPGTPKAVKQTINGIDNQAYTLELKGGIAYVVSYCDLPGNLVLTPETAINAYATSRRGKILSTKKVVLDSEYPGRDVVVQLPGGKRCSRIQIYIVKQRYYQLILEGPRDVTTSADADAFFSSFKRTE